MLFDPTHFRDKLQEDPTGIAQNWMKQEWVVKTEYDDLTLAESQRNEHHLHLNV